MNKLETSRTVVNVLVQVEDKILLLRRISKDFLPLHNKWELPAGTVESGETFQEAAERELHEETGLKVRIAADIVYQEEKSRHNQSLIFLFYVVSITDFDMNLPDIQLSEEHSEFCLVSIQVALALANLKPMLARFLQYYIQQ